MRQVCFVLFCVVALNSVCQAALHFKMEAPKTSLLPGETVTVTVSAWADDPAVSATNGLNYWAFSALVDQTGVLEVVDNSFILLAPAPMGSFVLNKTSINQPVTGGTGSINYLNVFPSSATVAGDTGFGHYDAIVKFDIRAMGAAGDIVTYTLGDTNGFMGILADGSTILEGVFDSGSGQNVFTIVPEPTSLLLLAGLTLAAKLGRRK